jgi:hypothetical protein
MTSKSSLKWTQIRQKTMPGPLGTTFCVSGKEAIQFRVPLCPPWITIFDTFALPFANAPPVQIKKPSKGPKYVPPAE